MYLVWNLQGHVLFRFTNVGGTNAVLSGIFFDASAPVPPTATASFVGSDTATQGNWKGIYGSDGYAIFDDSTSYPAYADVTPSGKRLTWAAQSTDARALQRAATGRIAACWYSASSFELDVNLTDGAAIGSRSIYWIGTTTTGSPASRCSTPPPSRCSPRRACSRIKAACTWCGTCRATSLALHQHRRGQCRAERPLLRCQRAGAADGHRDLRQHRYRDAGQLERHLRQRRLRHLRRQHQLSRLCAATPSGKSTTSGPRNHRCARLAARRQRAHRRLLV